MTVLALFFSSMLMACMGEPLPIPKNVQGSGETQELAMQDYEKKLAGLENSSQLFPVQNLCESGYVNVLRFSTVVDNSEVKCRDCWFLSCKVCESTAILLPIQR